MTILWRVGWTEEGQNTVYSVALEDKKLVGDICKTVEKENLSPTNDVWIEHCEVQWTRITG